MEGSTRRVRAGPSSGHHHTAIARHVVGHGVPRDHHIGHPIGLRLSVAYGYRYRPGAHREVERNAGGGM